MAAQSFGQALFGVADFGNAATVVASLGAAALPLSFTVIAPGAAALPLSFSVQGTAAMALPLSFSVAPVHTQWAINGVTALPWPQGVTYTPVGSLGQDLDGQTLLAGYAAVTWTYQVLLDHEIAQLMALYDPRTPAVTLTYLDADGYWQQTSAVWQPPQWGTRTTIEHKGISLTFTHLGH